MPERVGRLVQPDDIELIYRPLQDAFDRLEGLQWDQEAFVSLAETGEAARRVTYEDIGIAYCLIDTLNLHAEEFTARVAEWRRILSKMEMVRNEGESRPKGGDDA